MKDKNILTFLAVTFIGGIAALVSSYCATTSNLKLGYRVISITGQVRDSVSKEMASYCEEVTQECQKIEDDEKQYKCMESCLLAAQTWVEKIIPNLKIGMTAAYKALETARLKNKKFVDWLTPLKDSVCEFVKVVEIFGELIGKDKAKKIISKLDFITKAVCK